MNPELSNAAEARVYSPFWICLLVFLVLAADAGFRVARILEQRDQLTQAQSNQTATLKRLSSALAQLPEFERKLQAISVDLIQLGRTNPVAAQLIREFNINWNPGAETNSLSAVTSNNSTN